MTERKPSERVVYLIGDNGETIRVSLAKLAVLRPGEVICDGNPATSKSCWAAAQQIDSSKKISFGRSTWVDMMSAREAFKASTSKA